MLIAPYNTDYATDPAEPDDLGTDPRRFEAVPMPFAKITRRLSFCSRLCIISVNKQFQTEYMDASLSDMRSEIRAASPARYDTLIRIGYVLSPRYLKIRPQVRRLTVTVEVWEGMGKEEFDIGIEDLRYVLLRLQAFPNLQSVTAVLQLSMLGDHLGLDIRDDNYKELKTPMLAAALPINDLVANMQHFATIDLPFDKHKLERRVMVCGDLWKDKAQETDEEQCEKHNSTWYTAEVAAETESETTWRGVDLEVDEVGSWDTCCAMQCRQKRNSAS
nr:hypothetical protein B0A51_14492 [Rachicladosporium sp. CCFEE 5018]